MADATSPREDPVETLRGIMEKLHSRWRLVICVPLLYMVLGVLVWRGVFLERYNGRGLWPMGETALILAVVVGALVGAASLQVIGRLRARQPLQLNVFRRDPAAFLEHAKQTQLLQYMMCDLAALPGIVIFFLDGNMHVLAGFLLLSLVAYLRAIPSEQNIGRVFLNGLPEH